MKLRLSAIPAPLLALLAFLLSPEFYNKLPDKYAHWIILVAGISASLFPALFTKTE